MLKTNFSLIMLNTLTMLFLSSSCGSDSDDNGPGRSTENDSDTGNEKSSDDSDSISGDSDTDTGGGVLPGKYTLSTCPFNDGLENRFLGVKFGIEGEFGAALRVGFNEEGYDVNPYFDLIAAAYMRDDGINTIEALVSEAAVHWADPTSTDYRVSNIPQINAISFQIPTIDTAAVPFQFCLHNIELMFSAEAGGTTYVPLMPNADGWVGKEGNELALQGAWYTYREAGEYSTINMTVTAGTEIAPQSGSVCIDGTAAQIIDVNNDNELDYGLVWGAGVAFDLCATSTQ